MTSNYDDFSAFPERPSAAPNNLRPDIPPPPPPPMAQRTSSPRSIRKPSATQRPVAPTRGAGHSHFGPQQVSGTEGGIEIESGFGNEGRRGHAAKTPRDAVGGRRPLGSSYQATPTQSWLAGVPPALIKLNWLRSWPALVLLLFGLLGTAGTAAVISLFRIPNLPNCRAIFWPTASASLRLQCAESYAAQGDVQNLLAAIALVDQLPEDHPLRNDIINDRIESWATQVLDLAERSFENGDIDLAVDTAKKIPQRTAAAEVVEDRIARWQKIWKEGEESFNAAVAKLKAKDFQSAFSLSVKLLDVPNKYWATTRYNELTKLIGLAREDSRRMSEALGFAKEGTVKGFREALKRLKDIREESVFYAEAQGERKKIAKEMLKSGEDLLARQQLSDAQAMLNAIPRDAGLNKEIEDFQIFVTAYQQAWTGTVSGLESAINRMKSLKKGRPLHARAQQLIARWESELQDVALINQAKERASRGSTSDLNAAISIARQVSQNSPQWDAAAQEIGGWQTRVETVQDRPILERADRLAGTGTPDALRAAIQEAKKIPSSRTLGPEADERIANWTSRIQRIEDQPLLDQARQRAGRGDRVGAIAIASRIGEGRVLYGTAQEEVGRWQAQEDGRTRLGQAVSTASRGDADSLSNAIDLALQVPSGSDSRGRADDQIERWSWDLLRQAETAATRNLNSAITLAGRIPTQAEAYEPAQIRIRNWQTTLRDREDERQRANPIPAPPGRDIFRQPSNEPATPLPPTTELIPTEQ